MSDSVVNLNNKLTKIDEYWSPKIIAQMNDTHIKVAKVRGEYVWHSHADTDQVFMVLEGELQIEMPDRTVTLKKGDLFVVPKGVEHRPVAKSECHLLLVDPAGITNTGDDGGERAAEDEWI